MVAVRFFHSILLWFINVSFYFRQFYLNWLKWHQPAKLREKIDVNFNLSNVNTWSEIIKETVRKMSEQIKTIFHDKIHVSNQTDGSRPHRSAEKHFIAIYKFGIENVCKLLIYQYSIDKRNIGKYLLFKNLSSLPCTH